MKITYKYKLYSAKKNRHLHQTINLSGMAYNHCIALHKRYYRLTHKHLNQYALMEHLTKLKKRPKYAWMNQIPSQALQDVAQRIEKGYQLFFRNLKFGIRTAPPTFKKIAKYKSYTLKQCGWRLLDNGRISIAGRTYKFCKDRPIVGGIKTVTIKRDALNDLYLYFALEVEEPGLNLTTGKMAGFDFGIKQFLVVNDGEDSFLIRSPEFYKQGMNEIKRANKSLSSKVRGSHNRKKAKRNLAKVHKQIADKRQDWFFKLANALTDEYDCLFFETLNLKGMKKLWGRKVSDLAFGTFLNILKWVAKKKGKIVMCIDRFYPSSKTCHHCGFVNKNLSLSDRHWRCPSCNQVIDRDENAAINILREGASSLAGVGVSLGFSEQPMMIAEPHVL
jgi:putative transposase